ncbi:MAG: flagellar protein FlgN [Bacteriovoracaceae bacterium]
MNKENLELALYYDRAVEMWQRFCRLHSTLFEFTCEEYSVLLQSDIDALDPILESKQGTIEEIHQCETDRKTLITEMKENGYSINGVSDLISLFTKHEESIDQKYLQKFNLLLIEIIEKIQEQNKKNQVFLNKAIFSLREVRTSFQGKKSYSTYNSQGATTRSVSR